jgi:phosphatidylglycerol:prolipoprotein diacylglycerol transferase
MTEPPGRGPVKLTDRIMIPILFHIGPIPVYSFGAFMALAAITAALILHSELKRSGYNPEIASTMVLAAAIGGLIGARLLFIIEDLSGFLRSPMSYIATGAGFTWYGGFIGGTLAASWVVKKNRLPWHRAADCAAPALAAAYGIGRLGCHVAGDGDWGSVTSVPWGVAYTNAIIGWVDPNTGIPYPPGVRVHPTPIYEFLQSALIFAILWALRKRKYPPGTLFWLYVILAGVARAAVEIWRINPPAALGMSEAQWLGIGLALIGLWQLAQTSGRVTSGTARAGR